MVEQPHPRPCLGELLPYLNGYLRLGWREPLQIRENVSPTGELLSLQQLFVADGAYETDKTTPPGRQVCPDRVAVLCRDDVIDHALIQAPAYRRAALSLIQSGITQIVADCRRERCDGLTICDALDNGRHSVEPTPSNVLI